MDLLISKSILSSVKSSSQKSRTRSPKVRRRGRAGLSAAGVALTALALTAAVPSRAAADLVSQGSANAKFSAIGPGGLAIVGTTPEVKVQQGDHGSVDITVRLVNLKTGIDLRDKHMREKYLEVQKYPTAVFRIDRTALKLPEPGATREYAASGTMTLHGKTKPVAVRYQAKNDAGVFSVRGTLSLNMTDFGIITPNYFGVSVKPNVYIVVQLNATDKS